jgi:hypothetical protein
LVVSALVVSAGAIVDVVSAGAIVDVVSAGAITVVVSSVEVLVLLLHAAKVPIAKTINNFFICLRFFVM